jgi:hypothetical protein
MVINPLINYVIYESLKESFNAPNPSSVDLFIASSISKSSATFVTYPLLTARVRLQLAAKEKEKTAGQTPAPKNSTQKLSRITQFISLYDGIASKFIQTVLNNACMMVLYERIREYLRREMSIKLLKGFTLS